MVWLKAMLDGGIYLQVIGAQTQGLQGQQPANMAGLKKGGCTAVSNASAPFANDDVVLRTLEYAAGLNLTVVFYAEEPQIAKMAVCMKALLLHVRACQ